MLIGNVANYDLIEHDNGLRHLLTAATNVPNVRLQVICEHGEPW
jgi:hypothetical protein